MEISRTGSENEIVGGQPTVNTVQNSANNTIDNSVLKTDFAQFMKSMLGDDLAKEVNEEELFASLIEERLTSLNPEAAAHYNSKKQEYTRSMARSDGYVSVEAVAEKSLKETIDAGLITQEQGRAVRAESFRAAQLDDNLAELYDGRGSANDPTIATASLEAALLGARTILDKIESGEIDISTQISEQNAQPSSHTNIGGALPLDGAGGFVWKPASESDGKLVVLLPTELRNLISRVEIHAGKPNGLESLLEEGRFTGDTHNGNRPHYRFSKPGAAYGTDLSLVIHRTDGELAYYSIANGAQRHD